jgi:diguanylate cyclase (GGDEF)-like protein/PAS domain S-box-containing protein
MEILDLRTILISNVISTAICFAVMLSLYFQNRRRSSGAGYWAVGFGMQFFGTIFIALRGIVPDFFSIVVGNILLINNALFIFIGLEKYFQKVSSQRLNYIITLVFFLTTVYFTYAQPSLLARSLNFSICLLIFCSQAAWLLLRRVDSKKHSAIRQTGFIFAGYGLFSLVRIFSDLIIDPGANLLDATLIDSLVILTYQMLFIALTLALFLMVNRRLVNELEEDILQRSAVEDALRISDERFSKAFQNIPDAVLITLAEDGTILEGNESFYHLSGYAPGEAIGRTTVDLKLWKSAADRQNLTDQLQKQGHMRDIEATFYTKNGQAIPCQVSGETIYLQQGDSLLMIVRDISERKKIEQAEKEQRLLAEALVNSARALNSSLKFDEVLDLILDNLGRVVPHDTANIMVLEEEGWAQIMRCRGYIENGHADLTGRRVPLAEMAIINKVAANGRPTAIPDTSIETDWHTIPEVDWVKSYAIAPIRTLGHTIGFLNLESAQKGFFNQEHAERLLAFADQASIAIENASLYEDVESLALTDVLTGLFNRRGLYQFGERELARSRRFHHPLAAMMLDIDHFKKVNDSYGHQTGDRVLSALAACLRANVRLNVDILARYGGEEFFLLLPETDQASAANVAERIRQAVEDMAIEVAPDLSPAGENLQITISLGLVMLTPDITSLDEFIQRADQCMYAAKKGGRNRVVMGAADAT